MCGRQYGSLDPECSQSATHSAVEALERVRNGRELCREGQELDVLVSSLERVLKEVPLFGLDFACREFCEESQLVFSRERQTRRCWFLREVRCRGFLLLDRRFVVVLVTDLARWDRVQGERLPETGLW